MWVKVGNKRTWEEIVVSENKAKNTGYIQSGNGRNEVTISVTYEKMHY